jgi:hypothetical protein
MSAQLLVGYIQTEPRRGRRGPIFGQDRPGGPRHAYQEGRDRTLCGEHVAYATSTPWHDGIGSVCEACRWDAEAQPTPGS